MYLPRENGVSAIYPQLVSLAFGTLVLDPTPKTQLALLCLSAVVVLRSVLLGKGLRHLKSPVAQGAAWRRTFYDENCHTLNGRGPR